MELVLAAMLLLGGEDGAIVTTDSSTCTGKEVMANPLGRCGMGGGAWSPKDTGCTTALALTEW